MIEEGKTLKKDSLVTELAPMLVIEVPFSKWSHLVYRPLATYFTKQVNSAHSRVW